MRRRKRRRRRQANFGDGRIRTSPSATHDSIKNSFETPPKMFRFVGTQPPTVVCKMEAQL